MCVLHFFIHPLVDTWVIFTFWLLKIMFIHLLMDIWVVSTFWLLAMNIGVQVCSIPVLIAVPFGIYPSVELPGNMVILCSTFHECTKLYSRAVDHFNISINNAQGFQFFNIFISICYFPLKNNFYPHGGEIVSHGFDLHFPNEL